MTDKKQLESVDESEPPGICRTVRAGVCVSFMRDLFHGSGKVDSVYYLPSPDLKFRGRDNAYVLDFTRKV
jgi:hypothetical protein